MSSVKEIFHETLAVTDRSGYGILASFSKPSLLHWAIRELHRAY